MNEFLPQQIDFSKQCWPFLNKPSCCWLAGDFEHNRATWQSWHPVEIHLNDFGKLLLVSPACNQESRDQKGLEERVCKEQLKAASPSFLATCSPRWNPRFFQTVWICFYPFLFCFIVDLTQHSFGLWGAQPECLFLHKLPLASIIPSHTHISPDESPAAAAFACAVFFTVISLSLCLRPVES